jgi:hypothetical protein
VQLQIILVSVFLVAPVGPIYDHNSHKLQF